MAYADSLPEKIDFNIKAAFSLFGEKAAFLFLPPP